jgi:hypothetical protein
MNLSDRSPTPWSPLTTDFAQTPLTPALAAALARARQLVRARLLTRLAPELPGAFREQALRDAEALALLTPVPHLFLEELAREKAAAALVWYRRQQALREGHSLSFAA